MDGDVKDDIELRKKTFCTEPKLIGRGNDYSYFYTK